MIKKKVKEEEVRIKAKKPQQFGRVGSLAVCVMWVYAFEATIITDYIMENYC